MQEVYAFQHKKQIRMQSASGGAFTAIVEAWKTYWKSQGFEESFLTIYGAAFDNDFNIVHKRAIGNEWHEFRGSKYGVSDIKNIASLVLEDLSLGKKVLFSGTPCQVASIKKQMEIKKFDTKDIFYLDILCHGTPEKKVWDDYKSYIEKIYGGKLTQFCFRSKKTNFHEPVVYAEFTNGKKVQDTIELRSYLDLYFTYFPLRRCCYSCKFSNMQRISDITIGDFWGAEYIFKKIDTNKGISQVLINTEFGKLVWNKILEEKGYECCVKNSGKEFIRYQHNLSAPTERPDGVEQFWKYYNMNTFKNVVTKYLGSGVKYRLVFKIKRAMAYLGIKDKIKKIIKEVKK
jgi:hypothetical protein